MNDAWGSAVLLAALVACVVAVLIGPRAIRQAVRAFFQGEDHPLNLAIFRIAIFGTILVDLFLFHKAYEATEYSRISKTLLNPPVGLGAVLRHVPLYPGLTTILLAILTVTATLALVGFCTRTCAAATALISVYVLGIPRFFGMSDHLHHHIIWFAAILAASRCGDALSIDALRRASRRADDGELEPPGPSRAYALPIRFVWLLIGLIYFFSGFWKLWTSGLRWALSNNIRNLMWAAWAPTGHAPPIRIDSVSWLYKGAGLAAMAFELSFIFLIIFPATRRVARFVGLAFHNATWLMLRIPFWTLQACYVVFFDWYGIFRWLGRKAWRRELYFVYEGSSPLCRRTIARLRVVDLAQRVTYLDGSEPAMLAAHGLTRVNRAVLTRDVVVAEGNDVSTGYDAYRRLIRRIPLLWPALPLLEVAGAGRRIYRHYADTQARARPRARKARASSKRPKRLVTHPAAVVGGMLILAVGVCGSRNLEYTWPVSSYPTFAGVEEDTTFTVTTFATQTSGGPIREWSPAEIFGSWTVANRYIPMVANVLGTEDPNLRIQRLTALWEVACQHVPTLVPVTHVNIYQYAASARPSDLHKRPLGLTGFYSLTVHPQSGGRGFTLSADVSHPPSPEQSSRAALVIGPD